MKVTLTKGAQLKVTDLFRLAYRDNSYAEGMPLFITVKATKNAYPVTVIHFSTMFRISWLQEPPQELIDKINLLNGSYYDFNGPLEVDFTEPNRYGGKTVYSVTRLFEADAITAARIDLYFEFHAAEIDIQYEASSVERAIKL